MREHAVELVAGADGMIGAALLRRLVASGRRALGTSRRPDRQADGLLELDLRQPPDVWDGPPVSTVYLCAAVARLDACRRDPDGSAEVNIDGTVRLARLLAAQGAHIVYLSTNHVFDGTRPYRRAEEPTCPLNEYGRQKAIAEQKILALGESTAVLRLTKVLGERVPLFDAWAAALRKGERIRPYSDMCMAPVSLASVVEAIARLGQDRRAGVHHLSGNRDISYEQIARLVATQLDADASLIEPIAMLAASATAEPPPRYTTLEVSESLKNASVTGPDVVATVLEHLSTALPKAHQAA